MDNNKFQELRVIIDNSIFHKGIKSKYIVDYNFLSKIKHILYYFHKAYYSEMTIKEMTANKPNKMLNNLVNVFEWIHSNSHVLSCKNNELAISKDMLSDLLYDARKKKMATFNYISISPDKMKNSICSHLKVERERLENVGSCNKIEYIYKSLPDIDFPSSTSLFYDDIVLMVALTAYFLSDSKVSKLKNKTQFDNSMNIKGDINIMISAISSDSFVLTSDKALFSSYNMLSEFYNKCPAILMVLNGFRESKYRSLEKIYSNSEFCLFYDKSRLSPGYEKVIFEYKTSLINDS